LPAFERILKDVDNYFLPMKLTEDNICMRFGRRHSSLHLQYVVRFISY